MKKQTRREFFKTMGSAAASGAILSNRSMIGYAKNRDKHPNVILIITDDQGYGDLGCYGNEKIKTPNLDKLHAQSIRLTNYHVCPTCSPSRASLMTGRYCNRTGVWHTIMGRSLLRKDEVTMADTFAASGYRTAIFGKWHLGDNYPFRPQDHGFHEVLVHGGGAIGNSPDYWDNDYFDDTYFRNAKPEKLKGYCTDVWFDEAMKFIKENRDRPFFCYLTTNAAHGPYRVPDRYSQPYKDKGIKSPMAEFYGMITNIDENIGRLRQKLKALGLNDNTILIFMTDNGTAAGRRQGGFNAGMRGSKGSEYDGGHRVPCFIDWPGASLKRGRDISGITAHIDILPTLIELCALTKPESVKFDGTSLVPLLTEREKNWPRRTLVTDSQRVDHPIKWRKSATMTDRWRLINGSELYDMKVDPGQKNDIASKHPEVVRKLQQAYEDWWVDISKRFNEYCHIIIGSPKENPACLTTHDLHGEVVWAHSQTRREKRADGFWAVEVAHDGTYEIALRRWPKEANKPITESMPIQNREPDQKSIIATHARLKIADVDVSKPIAPGAADVKFRVQLKAGKTRLQAWFINSLGNGATYGVYFVCVNRLSQDRG